MRFAFLCAPQGLFTQSAECFRERIRIKLTVERARLDLKVELVPGKVFCASSPNLKSDALDDSKQINARVPAQLNRLRVTNQGRHVAGGAVDSGDEFCHGFLLLLKIFFSFQTPSKKCGV